MKSPNFNKIIAAIDERKIARCVAKGHLASASFQWTDDYSPPLLERVDELCRKYGVHVQVRFYGHHAEGFDAAMLRYLPSVQNLEVDCMDHIKNEDELAKLPQLRRLTFQVNDFDRPEFLSTLDLANLEVLTLGKTRKPNLDLKPLIQARCLRKFTVEGHRRGIESLSGAPKLEELILWAQPRSQSLAFVVQLPALRNLQLIRGGRETLDDIRHETLEFLGVTWVNGLRGMGPIGRFPKLKGLQVSDQIRLPSIDLKGASLKFLNLAGCKNLTDLQGLDDSLDLKEFTAILTALPLDELRDRRWPASLRVLRLWSSSMKWNNAARAQHDALGYKEVGKSWPQSDLDEFLDYPIV